MGLQKDVCKNIKVSTKQISCQDTKHNVRDCVGLHLHSFYSSTNGTASPTYETKFKSYFSTCLCEQPFHVLQTYTKYTEVVLVVKTKMIIS